MTFTQEQKTHHLKIYPEHFSAVLTGVKRAELRKNDRDFKVGDTLHLMETPKGSCLPTGEFVNAVVTHIADVGDWLPGYVLLSIEREPAYTAPPAPVVPKEIMPGGLVYSSALPKFESDDSDNVVGYSCFISGDTRIVDSQEQAYADAKAVVNACRAAMLQGNHRDLSYPVDPQIAAYEKIMGQAIPDGYALVPVEPTEDMVIHGFESVPHPLFQPADWDKYQTMSGCEQAAHRARLCWAAMIAAAPQQEV